MLRKVDRYGVREYGSIPERYASLVDAGPDEAILAVDGQEVPDGAADSYFALMRRFSLGFAFFPYCTACPGINFAFERPNPLIEVTAPDGSMVDCVRMVNPGLMFFLPEFLFGVKMDSSVGLAFMEKFVDDLASVGGIPSNGVFLDVHGSASMVPPYRRSAIRIGDRHLSDVKALGVKVDASSGRVVARIRESIAAEEMKK